eukprot:SAG11_NODE_1448_length_4887_cov_2.165831_6_plen_206_part_00
MVLAASVIDNLFQLMSAPKSQAEQASAMATMQQLELPLRAILRQILAPTAAGGSAETLVKRTFISVLCRSVLVDASSITALCARECGEEGAAAEGHVLAAMMAHWGRDALALCQKSVPISLISTEGRREFKLCALALCRLLAVGCLPVAQRLPEALRIVLGAMTIERSAAVPPQLDLQSLTAKEVRPPAQPPQQRSPAPSRRAER